MLQEQISSGHVEALELVSDFLGPGERIHSSGIYALMGTIVMKNDNYSILNQQSTIRNVALILLNNYTIFHLQLPAGINILKKHLGLPRIGECVYKPALY